MAKARRTRASHRSHSPTKARPHNSLPIRYTNDSNVRSSYHDPIRLARDAIRDGLRREPD